MSFTIRRLTETDAAAYRLLRLEALRNAPEAFGDSHEEAAARPDAYWTRLFDGRRVFFGAHVGDSLAGIVNYMRAPGIKEAHKGSLLGLYVRPDARKSGCGRALVEAVLDHARQTDAEQVLLTVAARNDAARHLYESKGFEVYGMEPRALKIDGVALDEYLMVAFLDER
ncbi:N-acetyltransferase [Oricola sp.]|uniref:GNAT family N-acetyltransferase n=1 Tax=Oricola sp. TaxID=1979950 RepID=UPI0025DBF943|nr:N-acetyltransferase [Oricola sp.]MCI5077538.1 GNAT family N-acetyltransferase [Oricola sp.]